MATVKAALLATVWLRLALVPCAAASEKDKKCGCSWARAGCGVSTEQLVNGLAYSPVNRMCEQRSPKDFVAGSWAARECRARHKVKDVLPKFQLCQGYGAAKCSRETQCQWGAQATGKCGIDEEELLIEVLRRDYKSLEHPLIRMIRMHDECSKLGEHTCEANTKCAWQDMQGGARHCDLNMAAMYATLLEHPSILVLLDTIVASSRCRAMYEHGDPPVCAGQCEVHEDICMLGSDSLLYPRYPPVTMVNAICAAEVSQHTCPDPCVRNESSLSCHAPAELPRSFTEPRLTETDWNVIEVFYAISSATMVHEAQCNSLATEAACGDATTACSLTHVTDWGSSDGQAASGPAAAGPGFNGALGRLAAALEAGTAGQDFEEFLQANPDKIAQQLAPGLSKGWKRLHAEDKKIAAETTRPPPAPRQGTQKPLSILDAAFLPYALAAFVLMALCGGVATGTLCHAGFAQWGFREPGVAQGDPWGFPSSQRQRWGTRLPAQWERAAIMAE